MRNCLKLSLGLLVSANLVLTANAQDGGSGERTEIRVESKELPAPVEARPSRELAAGKERVLKPGKKGYVKYTYEVLFADDKPVNKKLIKEERVAPQPRVVLRGSDNMPGFPELRADALRE